MLSVIMLAIKILHNKNVKQHNFPSGKSSTYYMEKESFYDWSENEITFLYIFLNKQRDEMLLRFSFIVCEGMGGPLGDVFWEKK